MTEVNEATETVAQAPVEVEQPVVAPEPVKPAYDGKFKTLEDVSLVQQTITVKKEDGTEIGDVTFGFPGVRKAMEVTDLLGDQGYSFYADKLLKETVVQPGALRVDGLAFFDTHEGIQEVLLAADKFLGEKLNRVSDK